MLDANIKNQLKTYLERVTQPIEIVASLDDSDKSREMQALLGDIAEQSNLITIVDVAATPSASPPSRSTARARTPACVSPARCSRASASR